MIVRAYREGDAAAMAALYVRSVREIGARDYSPEQVAAWAGLGPDAGQFAVRMADGRRCWIAEGDDGAMLGFVDLEADGHIDLLYLAPEAVGTGVAGLLADALEMAARTDKMDRLYVEASEAARRFFLKRGYAVIARRDFEVRGVAIHNYAMERRLSAERV